jgi:predicted amidophosphoribosyltransferase
MFMATKKCPKCFHDIPEGVDRCPNCAYDVSLHVIEVIAKHENPKTEHYEIKKENKQDNKPANKNKNIGCIVTIIIIIAIIIISAGGGSSSNSKVCGVCHRTFSDSENTWSITLKGMCSNCYENYKWAKDVKDHYNN